MGHSYQAWYYSNVQKKIPEQLKFYCGLGRGGAKETHCSTHSAGHSSGKPHGPAHRWKEFTGEILHLFQTSIPILHILDSRIEENLKQEGSQALELEGGGPAVSTESTSPYNCFHVWQALWPRATAEIPSRKGHLGTFLEMASTSKSSLCPIILLVE